MKKARWLLESFTSDELDGLKAELKDLLAQCDGFPLLRELLEKIQIDLHSRYLNKELRTWRRKAKSERMLIDN